jgi:hypothetical protein
MWCENFMKLQRTGVDTILGIKKQAKFALPMGLAGILCLNPFCYLFIHGFRYD